MAEPNISDWQKKWFASVIAGLERDTGKTMAEWVQIAKTCPETAHRARLKWFKENHGLLQARASQVISAAFPSGMGWSQPDKLRAALWTDPASTAILQAVEAAVTRLPDVVANQRKGYSAWSRKVQFAAVKPVRGGTARLGLAVPLDASPRLVAPKNESWSERLKAATPLASPAEVDAEVEALIRRAWEGA